MCKDCEDIKNKNEELEQENVSLEDMDKEQLLDIVYSLLEQKDKENDDKNGVFNKETSASMMRYLMEVIEEKFDVNIEYKIVEQEAK